MQFYRHDDGSMSVDRFDEEITFTFELLNELDPKLAYVAPDWSSVTFLGKVYWLIVVDNDAKTATFRIANG